MCIANQKGGVGKSTATINIGGFLSTMAKTLLIDLDYQGNCTTGIGVRTADITYTITEVLSGECKIENAIIKTKFENLDLIPSDVGLAGLMDKLKIDALSKTLSPIINNYNFILIDSRPDFSILTTNALAAADRVLIPIKPGSFALDGLTQLYNQIEHIRIRGINPKLRILGIFYNEVNINTNLFKSIQHVLENSSFKNYIMETIIPANVRIGEAQAMGVPISYFDTGSSGYNAFVNLSAEVLEKWEKNPRLK